MKSLLVLNKYFWKYKYHFALGIVFIIISNFFAILPAQIVRHAFDLIGESIDYYFLFKGQENQENLYAAFASAILLYGLLIVVMALLRGFFLFLVRQTIITMSRHIEYDQKNEIYKHYQSLPLSFYRRNNTGDLMARISEDVSKVRMYIGPAIMYGINLIVLLTMVISYMLSVNTTLTLYVLAPLPILSISIYYVNNIVDKRSEEIQRALSGLSTFVQEAFSGIRVIKSFAKENESVRDFTVESNDYRSQQIQLNNVLALFMPLIMGLIGLSTIFTVYIGGLEVFDGAITTGNIAEFVIYVNMLTWPVTSIGWVTSITQRAAASQRRINEFLDIKNEMIVEYGITPEIKGEVTFENVGFTYQDSGIKALENISFHVGSGKSLAILGTTGSGKSTIANLILRLFDPSSGRILLDGIDLKDYDMSHVRKYVGYVPQDVFLFSDTIANNIAFGTHNEISQEEIVSAAEDADLANNITQFSKGYDTKIGERGLTLSGGQKQRLSIARALLVKPKILVLDDALSAVDTNTENTILNALKENMVDKTTLIISHRVSSAKLADYIIMLDEGRIIEEGTHEMLINKNGSYKLLYEKQLSTEETLS